MPLNTDKKLCIDVSMDSASSESLSFASLVCVQQPHHPSPSLPVIKVPRQSSILEDQEFEFSCVKAPGISTGKFPTSNLQPSSTIKINSNQVKVANKHSDLATLLPPIPSHGRKSHEPTKSNIRSSSSRTQKHIKKNEKRKSGGGQSFGQKLFSSLSPCKNCRAAEPITPTLKQHA